MIIKEGRDLYRIDTLGEKEDLLLSEQELLTRLRKSGVWSEVQLQELISQDVGYETVRPYGKYV